MEVGIVTKIYIHPLKCGTPLVVNEVECSPRGPSIGSLKDRGFMVATPANNAVDLRGKHPTLVLVELAQVEEGTWKLSGIVESSQFLAVTWVSSSWIGAICLH